MTPPVLILCGGQGTRLREETEFRPKPMVEIGGRPILWHIMKLYASAGFGEYVLCLGYKGQMIKDFFLNYRQMVSDFTIRLGDHKGIHFHDHQALEDWTVTCADTGYDAMTGARVKKALRYVEGDTFCLTYGDGLTDVDLKKVLAFHKAHGRIGTVTAVNVASRFGEMAVDGEGRVQAFSEKPDSGGSYVSGGFFVFDKRRLLPHLRDGDDLVFEREPMAALVEAGELVAYKHDGFWQCMDTYREWQMLERLWASGEAPWAVWDRR